MVLHAIMDIVLPQLAVQAELSFSLSISVGDERNRLESLPADDSSRYLAFEVPQLRMKIQLYIVCYKTSSEARVL